VGYPLDDRNKPDPRRVWPSTPRGRGLKRPTFCDILRPVANATFNKRFKEIVRDLSDTELGYILGVTADAARKMRSGDIKSLKLQAALRLARKMQISPWYLAGEPEPASPLAQGPPGRRGQQRGQRAADRTSERAQLDTAESALLLLDELVALQKRVRRLEAAVAKLRSRA
jgi:hypothetical protein